MEVKTDWDIINELQQRIRQYGIFNWTHFSLKTGKQVKPTHKQLMLTLMVNDYVVAGKISRKGKTILEFVTHEFGMPLPELKQGQNMADIKLPDVNELSREFNSAVDIVQDELHKIKIARLTEVKRIAEKEHEDLEKRLSEVNEALANG